MWAHGYTQIIYFLPIAKRLDRPEDLSVKRKSAAIAVRAMHAVATPQGPGSRQLRREGWGSWIAALVLLNNSRRLPGISPIQTSLSKGQLYIERTQLAIHVHNTTSSSLYAPAQLAAANCSSLRAIIAICLQHKLKHLLRIMCFMTSMLGIIPCV